MTELLTAEQIANQLIYPLFRGIDSEYKSRYKMIIWEHFTQRVTYAAGAETLATFYERISRKLPIQPNRDDHQTVMTVLSSGQDEHILDMLRSELRLIVLHCQLLSQDKNEAYKERQKQKEQDRADNEAIAQEAAKVKRPQMSLPIQDNQTSLGF